MRVQIAPGRLLAIGMFLLGVIDLAIWNIHILAIDLALTAAVGIPVAAFQAGYLTLMQTAVADRFRRRILGALATTTSLLMLAAIPLSGALAGVVGVVPMLDISAFLDALGGIAAFLLLVSPRSRAPAPAQLSEEVV